MTSPTRALFEAELLSFLNSDESHFRDPIDCLAPDLSPQEGEIISLIVAGLSYGRVEQIQKSSFDLIKRFEALSSQNSRLNLSEYLRTQSRATIKKEVTRAIKGWKHRLNTDQDMVAFLLALEAVLKKHQSIARLYQSTWCESPKEHLILFVDSLLGLKANHKRASTRTTDGPWKGTGVQWFAPSPRDGGTCKRLLMWLRWVIRKDRFDKGYWQDLSILNSSLKLPEASRLFVPVDTHILKWAKQEGVVTTLSPTWKTTEEVTAYFKKICPEDPLRFDFMICHEGMRVFRLSQKPLER